MGRHMFEKRLPLVSVQAFTANGDTLGRVTTTQAQNFKVKRQVILSSNTVSQQRLEVKRVESATVLYVGPISTPITTRSDISAYLVVDSASIQAPEQPRPSIPEQEIERLTYEEEPVIARRVVLVDELGNKINDANPLPVTAAVDVALEAFNATPDNVLIVGSEDGTKTGVKHVVKVASDGSVQARNFSSLVPEPKTKIEIIARNANGDISVARFSNGLSTICDLQLSYDSNGDFAKVERV